MRFEGGSTADERLAYVKGLAVGAHSGVVAPWISESRDNSKDGTEITMSLAVLALVRPAA
jgi:hypothetical protein